MAPPRKTTSATSRTATSATAKPADDTAAADAAKAKAAEDAAKKEPASSVDAENVEGKVERNPELDGGVDKVADQAKVDAKAQKDSANEDQAAKREKQLKDFTSEGRPTSESWDDPQVNLANLPANHDPVVTADHSSASGAMEVDQGKLKAAAPVQISNFDNSDLSRNVLDSMSAKTTVEVKDSDKSK